MALRLAITVAKTIPGNVEYSSIKSSCSIEAEVAANGQDIVAEAERLQQQAQLAVDQFLGIAHVDRSPQPATTPPGTNIVPAPQTSQPPAQRPAGFGTSNASQPYRSTGQRRGPSLASAAQLRYLRQLLDKSGHTMEEVCTRFGIPQVEYLRSRDASQVIDEIRGSLPAGTG